MRNLLDAIVTIKNLENLNVKDFYKSRNRANNMGESLELFVKDAFAGAFECRNETEANSLYTKIFSYLGNQNNPPDAIILGGDAIEIKKIESFGSSLALNSSYPKDKLRSTSPMITKACRACEDWNEKDILYCVGVVNDKTINGLCFVYGVDYAADFEIYERIKDSISEGVCTIPGIEFSDTKELGRVNKVDPLGITYLRIRGMWGIENPFKVFIHVTQSKFFAIINSDKYNSFPKQSRDVLERIDGVKIAECKIKDPNNPAKLKDAILISF